MSILSTIAVHVLSNSIALNELLRDERCGERIGDTRFWERVSYAAFMNRDSSRPEHVFTNRWNLLCHEQDQVDVLVALQHVGEAHLEIRHGLLYVKDNQSFGRWQNIRNRMTTLPVKISFLHQKGFEPSRELAHPYAPHMNDLIRHEGLHELHLHLNGYAYPEECWLNALYHIDTFVQNEHPTYQNPLWKRIYTNLNPELNPTKLANRLKLAKIIRCVILEIVGGASEKSLHTSLKRVESALEALRLEPGFFVHTPSTWVNVPSDLSARMEQEIHMWHRAFRLINEGKHHYTHSLKKLLHLYLLLQNEYIMLYRHNEQWRGFRLFDAACGHDRSFVGSRAYYRDTLKRIDQAACPNNKTCIELRLTPSGLIRNKDKLLHAWRNHWIKALKIKPEDADRLLEARMPKLILVAHFIKTKKHAKRDEKKPIRISNLYEEESARYMKEAADFATHVKGMLREKQFYIGIDAAGNEIDNPPEVFAAAFRLFERRTHVQHKTFHCGEDFHHLLSGIRTIYEAIKFLDLSKGNRIGHATAIGITPQKWLQSMPAKIVMSREEWFLDLLFARKYVRDADLLYKIEQKISHLANAIFCGHHLEQSLETRSRQQPPCRYETPGMQALDDFFEARKLSPLYDESKNRPILTTDGDEEQELYETFRNDHGEAGLALYHRWRMDPDVRERMMKPIEVPIDFIPSDSLVVLQQKIQQLIHDKEIAVETLLISNLRISQYDDVSEHHILRWLKVKGYKVKGDVDFNICLGSDDPGVFVTDIKNEYYHLYNILLKANLSEEKAMEHIRRINHTGRVYSFTSFPQCSPERDFASLFRSAGRKFPQDLFANPDD